MYTNCEKFFLLLMKTLNEIIIICFPDIHSELLVMPVIQQHSQERADKMFFEHANLQHPRRHHEPFLRSRPYRGELPTEAGKAFLLLCFRTIFNLTNKDLSILVRLSPIF